MLPDRISVHDKAAGRWPGILAEFGVEAPLLNVRKHHPCPWCGGKDRFRFTDKDGTGAFFCNQCGHKSPLDFLMHRRGWDFATAAREVEGVLGLVAAAARSSSAGQSAKRHREMLNALWNYSKSVEAGDPVSLWLASRGITLGAFPPALRFCASCRHTSEDGNVSWHPAMVAKVIAADDTPCTLHRTYLTRQGQKAPVDRVRMLMPGGLSGGSSVRLMRHDAHLGIAEGIETALAAALLHRVPTWAALTAGNLEKWNPPANVRRVTVFADNDESFTGHAAAYALAKRLKGMKLDVEVRVPERVKEDWNDVLLEGAA